MSYIFPYYLINKGSRIAVYGFGKVGRDFFRQIERFQYCECVAYVDEKFKYYEDIEYPFAQIEDLKKIDFDYVIIAVLDKKTALEIRENLQLLGIQKEKIVWSENYLMDHDIWPMNKKRYLSNPQFYMSITDKYFRTDGIYGRIFYQSYSELGIHGIRNTQERIGIYKVREFLKKTDSILNIGCNCGFLDLQISCYIGNILGMDIEPLYIEIANETKKYMGIENAEFEVGDYYAENVEGEFDAVFSLAVHTNIMVSGASEDEYIDRVMKNVKQNGYLFFESHNLLNDAERYKRLCKKFVDKGMQICHHANYFSDFDRDITVFQKKK